MLPDWPKPLIAILADTFVSPADSREDRKPNEFGDTLELRKFGAGKKDASLFILADSVFGSSRHRRLFVLQVTNRYALLFTS
jgi:hypothetical protein